MKIFLLIIIFIFFLPIFSSTNQFDWQTLKTDNFTIFYKPGFESQAKEILNTLEYYKPAVEKLIGNHLENIPIVIEDIGTQSNGFTNPIFFNLHLFTYKPSGNELESTENWWRAVGIHEYAHILHLSKVNRFPKILTNIFGNIYLPNTYSPGWIMEGITVYTESKTSHYEGRLNDGLFDAYMGASVKDNRLPNILKATYTPLEMPLYRDRYIYGGEFFNFLSKKYGEEKFAIFFNQYGSSILSYVSPAFPFLSFDLAAKKVYGKSFPKLWEEWCDYEKEKYKNFAIDGEKITNYGWELNDLKIFNNKLYFNRTYPVKTAQFSMFTFNEIVKKDLSTNEEKVLIQATSPFSGSMRIHKNKLYYSLLEVKQGFANATNYSFGYYSVLHEKDISTGDDIILFADEMRGFDILPDGNILFAKDIEEKFGSEIYLYDKLSQNKKLLFTTDYFVSEIAVNNSTIAVSARHDFENFSIYTLNLETKEFTPIINTPYFEGNINFCEDLLLFTTNYEKIHSLYSYDFSTKKISKLTEGGFASSGIYNKEKSMIYFIGLNSYGFDIYRKNFELKEFLIPTYPLSNPPILTLLGENISKGGYIDDLKTLFPKIRYPMFFSANKDESIAGVGLAGQDAIGLYDYSVLLLYNLKKDTPHLSINLNTGVFAPILSAIEYTDIEKKLLKFSIKYPLIYKLSPGVSGLFLGSSFNFIDDLKRKELSPFIEIFYNFVKTTGNLEFHFPIEQKKLGSKINRGGIIADFNLKQYIKKSQILFKVKGISDRDNTDIPFDKIRGYIDALNAREGGIFSLEYSKPMCEIRKGFWNPNIYFEDLGTTIFVDTAAAKHVDTQLSGGLELHLETKTFFKVNQDVGTRIVFPKNKNTGLEFFAQVVW